MCMVCVEIARGRVTMKDASDVFRETIRSGASLEERDHAAQILGAYAANDDKEVDQLVKAGVKKERWL